MAPGEPAGTGGFVSARGDSTAMARPVAPQLYTLRWEANRAVRWHIVELDSCATDTEQAVRSSCDYLVGGGLSSGRRVVPRR